MATATMLAEKVRVRPGRVFGRELDVVHIGARQANRGIGLFERFRARDLQLVLEVNVRAGEEYVNARPVRPFHRAGSGYDVFVARAGKGGDAWAANLAADAADRGKVTRRCDGEASLHDIDPSASSAWAMRSFSGVVMLQPGDCSPSRRVVSKKKTRSWPRPF